MFKLDFFFENFYNLSLCNIRVQLEATERAPRKFKKMADGSLSLSLFSGRGVGREAKLHCPRTSCLS